MPQLDSEYADLLNSLCDMQDAMIYAVRRPVLAAAEQAIVKLEASLIATQKELEKCTFDNVDLQVKYGEALQALALRGEPVAWRKSTSGVEHGKNWEQTIFSESPGMQGWEPLYAAPISGEHK